jgi:DNA topoisomerase-1
LSLPRDIGQHPESGKMISAGLGRYGPFVLHEKTYANLESIEDVFSIGLNRAVYGDRRENRQGSRSRTWHTGWLKTLDDHPDGGPITVRDGKYGPYVNWGKINATLPKDKDPASVTMEEALELITAKAGASGKKKKPAAKKPAAKKTAKPKAKKATTAKAKPPPPRRNEFGLPSPQVPGRQGPKSVRQTSRSQSGWQGCSRVSPGRPS